MRIALCQINPTVGDLAGNARVVLDAARRAAEQGADLAVFSELALTGYPPQDLLDRPAFLDDADAALLHVARNAPAGLGIVIGGTLQNPHATGKSLFNAAYLLDGGEVVDVVSKALLPTYDVFDEVRYFEPSVEPRRVVTFRGVRLGVHVCEDLWNNLEEVGDAHESEAGPLADSRLAGAPRRLYAANPIDELGALGVDLFVNVSASPFAAGKPAQRRRLIGSAAREWGVPFVYVNQYGANTELVFDGDSQVQNAAGEVVWRARDFQEDLFVWDTDDLAPREAPLQASIESVHDALVLGIRDYVRKTGPSVFNTALIGLSGGIDSALTCALAVEALGAENVTGITMPSKYSSGGSVSDSRLLADALGIAFHEVSIRPAVDAFDAMLVPVLGGEPEGVTEENLQARARGVTLMAVSNAQGHLLLTTGNKSETAVGYATLYGDMSGGLAVLSDVYKTDVYLLARHVNERAGREVIPEDTLTKPPSAELRPGQTDQQSLPPYDVLDAVLKEYVECHASVDAIVAKTGLDRALVARVAAMVDRNEYKRRQAAPGLRVSAKAFGVGRRLPVVMQVTRVEAPTP
ncbi:MAG TPA: NAD+ synthase [Rubricoccaceae bacterium]|jgi:NAD+ synthase (glutamine-hydrolysing)